MTVREIVAAWLLDHGYAGLLNRVDDCFCEAPDVMDCETYYEDCQPARRVLCRCHAGCEACDGQRWLLSADED
jgi:hypothetical protein